ncbi:MAG: hypothetical protein ACERLG_04880 [Sedimentibacter sp.]
MPEVSPNNKLFPRGGVRLNNKRHIEMTEEEKANIALCQGIKATHQCKNPVFRCTECGNYGCVQEVAGKCTQQGFKNDKCLHCGAVGSLIPVMEDELEKFIKEWEKNDL